MEFVFLFLAFRQEKGIGSPYVFLFFVLTLFLCRNLCLILDPSSFCPKPEWGPNGVNLFLRSANFIPLIVRGDLSQKTEGTVLKEFVRAGSQISVAAPPTLIRTVHGIYVIVVRFSRTAALGDGFADGRWKGHVYFVHPEHVLNTNN